MFPLSFPSIIRSSIPTFSTAFHLEEIHTIRIYLLCKSSKIKLYALSLIVTTQKMLVCSDYNIFSVPKIIDFQLCTPMYQSVRELLPFSLTTGDQIPRRSIHALLTIITSYCPNQMLIRENKVKFSATTLWNSLPVTIKQSLNIFAFISALHQFLQSA